MATMQSITIKQKAREYESWLKKFDAKKTTDDCYTPQLVYLAVAEHVAEKYKLNVNDFVRPFFPGGDFQNLAQYSQNSVVVDNPPFSILAKILDFYLLHKVKFFLFAPSLTMLTTLGRREATAIFTHNSVTYENGASVNTSFITNLEPSEIIAKTDPELYRKVKQANKETQQLKQQPKYTYPDELMTQNTFRNLVITGGEFELYRQEVAKVSTLDNQKKRNKSIFGGGYLIGEKAQERLAIAKQQAKEYRIKELRQEIEELEKGTADPGTVWELSDREKELIKNIDKENYHGR